MKRYRPRAVRRPKPARAGPAGLLRQPPPGFYRLPELEIRGGAVLTDGCRRVLEFTPQCIRMDLGQAVITLYGTGLGIESLSGRRLAVTGRLTSIEFARKWGEQDG